MPCWTFRLSLCRAFFICKLPGIETDGLMDIPSVMVSLSELETFALIDLPSVIVSCIFNLSITWT